MSEPRFTCKYCGSHTGSFELEFDEWKHKNLLECVGVLKSELSRLQSEARWIPVSEREPDLPQYGVPRLIECVDVNGVYWSPVVFTYDKEYNFNDGERWSILPNMVMKQWRFLPTPPTEG